ncbi:MAG: ABC transporter permease [Crocinitomicaceae bacterium]|nr:ABC transporter permease [Crocinitomicaceae bacterium]MCF8411637.1 ABC transporter permease [Crocinitomicaceae bacterium]MCF8444668.1 ABC transporter permease [Crocinitomicaceae bacterium]
MKRLIRIEWLKNFSYFPVILFSSIYFVLVIGFTLMCAQTIPIFGISIKLLDQGFLNFPQIWNFLTYFTGLLKIFLGLIVIFTISNEFTNKLFKQNIIDGLSRKEFLFSKVLTITLLSLLSTGIVVSMGLILGFSFSKSTELNLVFKESYFILGYFLKLFSFLTFLLFITVLLKKVVFVFLTFFIWWVIEIVLTIMEYQSRVIEKFDESGRNVTEKIQLLTDFLPLNTMSKLVEEPFQRIRLIESMTGGKYTFEIPYLAVITAIGYSLLFLYGTFYIMKKRDW